MRKRSWFRRIELCVGEQMFGQSSGKATRTGVFGETDSGSRRAQARSACFAPSSRTSGWRDLCRPVASSHSARRRKSRPAHVCQPSGFPLPMLLPVGACPWESGELFCPTLPVSALLVCWNWSERADVSRVRRQWPPVGIWKSPVRPAALFADLSMGPMPRSLTNVLREWL